MKVFRCDAGDQAAAVCKHQRSSHRRASQDSELWSGTISHTEPKISCSASSSQRRRAGGCVRRVARVQMRKRFALVDVSSPLVCGSGDYIYSPTVSALTKRGTKGSQNN